MISGRKAGAAVRFAQDHYAVAEIAQAAGAFEFLDHPRILSATQGDRLRVGPRKGRIRKKFADVVVNDCLP